MSGWDKQNLQRETYAPVDWKAEKKFKVYLPEGAQWYDYWTNTKLNGGQTLEASAPLSHAPLYIKAGSILPLSPAVQYANENKFDNLDLVIYPGADATFILYEDEGDNYNYEKGKYTTIPLIWNDRSKTLTIGKRTGSFDGMLATRTFHVKIVGGTQKTVTYNGQKVSVK